MSRGLIGLLLAAVVASFATACFKSGPAQAAQATVVIHYSHFTPELITARAGEPVTVTLRNTDPIEHEWIVGIAEVHERHRTGTEAFHGSIPTEVTIPALSTRVTTVTFDQPGDYLYVCHLPGHEAYGMVGTLWVVGR